MHPTPSQALFTSLLSLTSFAVGNFTSPPSAAAAVPQDKIRALFAEHKTELFELYEHLHASPELSLHEEKTSATLAGRMRRLGFDVSENVGGFGVVCILRNGPGKTILVRTDMDALPVEEKTELPFASKIRTKDALSREVSVMHACGHDFHMTCWYGAAHLLASMKQHWSGTLVFIAQPAEEFGVGALAMLKAGLFNRFPKPDLCLAMHTMNGMPAGSVGLTSGVASANTDSVDILVHGLGGHGAMPDKTKDPVVLASQIVLALQTIRSRELSPQEPAVITVGSIHGGSKHNIIPDEVRLQITVRTVSAEARAKALAAIARIAKGQGIASGLPEKFLPEVQSFGTPTPMISNDPALTARLRDVFVPLFGADSVLERKPMMGGEDFGRYGTTAEKIPICLFWVGATPAAELASAADSGTEPPSLHSPFFHPNAPVSLPVGVTAMTAALLDQLQK